ncbi:MAG: flagellar biosynthesis protein FliQ [Pseudomonadales bacterium]|jgi:flagellar biosynthetic protein FliQ|nr:flagellar biosynthesis protein FliQ [Pseudomonadales bacterium]
MVPEAIGDLMRQAMFLIISMVSVLILPSLFVGLLVSVFQAATQINEQTLSFLPRLLTTFVVMVMAGPWLVTEMLDFSANLFNQLHFVVN